MSARTSFRVSDIFGLVFRELMQVLLLTSHEGSAIRMRERRACGEKQWSISRVAEFAQLPCPFSGHFNRGL